MMVPQILAFQIANQLYHFSLRYLFVVIKLLWTGLSFFTQYRVCSYLFFFSQKAEVHMILYSLTESLKQRSDLYSTPLRILSLCENMPVFFLVNYNTFKPAAVIKPHLQVNVFVCFYLRSRLEKIQNNKIMIVWCWTKRLFFRRL